jgi:hypothetical protein
MNQDQKPADSFIDPKYPESTRQLSTPPVSGVNEIAGMKKAPNAISLSAVMSVPRLGFMDNFFSVFQALIPLKIPIRKGTGAFWGQCLERVMVEAVATDKPGALLTLDYDTVFGIEDVGNLARLLVDHPEADAIAAVQSHRSENAPLMTIQDKDMRAIKEVPLDYFQSDLSRVSTAHFGLTLIRTSSLAKLPHPWFKGVPAEDGTWGEGHIDDDIWFWKRWEEIGNTLYLANRVVIGHGEWMIKWPGRQFKPVYQHPNDFFKQGAPVEAWQ